MHERRRSLLIGVAIILVSAFFDNIRGLILPLFARSYGLDYGRSSAFFWLASAAAFLGSAASVRLLLRWSERTYLHACLALQAAAVLLVGSGRGYASFLLGGFLWGAANSGIGFAANLVVLRSAADENLQRSMSALHLFYGLGAVLPAAYVSALADRLAPGPLVLPALLLAAALWACSLRLPEGPARPQEDPAAMPWRRMLRPRPLSAVAVLSFYVLGEVLLSMWLASYLTGALGLSPVQAGRFQQNYFLALAASRALGAFLLWPGAERLLPAPLMLAAAAAAAAGSAGWTPGFLAASFCFGPVFPLLASKMSLEYPRDYPRLLAFAYAAMTIALALGHVLLGRIADFAGIRAALRLPPACLVLAAILLLLLSRQSRNEVL